ncbi:MAG: hypothetical protein EOM64_05060 [Erysipelotrichia bacterium]|nr:hypothetical protein [Erysipelotrichia bacterium]
MNRKPKPSSSNLFLLELILSILIFALASTVCVSFFIHSHKMSIDAYRLNRAVECADSAAEICRSADSRDQLDAYLKDAYGSSIQTSDQEDDLRSYLISYDDSFQLTLPDQAEYSLRLTLQETEGIMESSIAVVRCDSMESIYSLEVMHAAGGRQ